MKEFTPNMVKSIYDNLDSGDKIMKKYVMGINDDVCNTHLPYGP